MVKARPWPGMLMTVKNQEAVTMLQDLNTRGLGRARYRQGLCYRHIGIHNTACRIFRERQLAADCMAIP